MNLLFYYLCNIIFYKRRKYKEIIILLYNMEHYKTYILSYILLLLFNIISFHFMLHLILIN